MTPAHLSEIIRSLAPGLGNHLWQSTLFALAAGLLTLILRKNHARARYALWLAASIKFLIPFSLLVSLGSLFSRSHAYSRTNAGVYFAMEEVSQPFTQPTLSLISPAAPSASQTVLHFLPAILLAAWFCGFATVLLVWCLRWRRISATLREAAPLLEGREVEALRRLERIAGLRMPMQMVSSPTSLEPGVFGIGVGIARPVLIWPAGISEHLEDAHLEAILAHELWHVRRRDNLAAAIHMVVEALFWFHPLVWWLGARLVEERERACDEQVLEMGSRRQIYAESILKVCEFCVGSPLACVSGVTGSDLKKRMVNIMTERITRKLDFSKKLLLSTSAALALALPIVFGLVDAPQIRAQAQMDNVIAVAPTYKSASIRPHKSAKGVDEPVGVMFFPDGFTARNTTLLGIIGTAYGVQPDVISGAPDWVSSEKYDIDIKLPNAPAADAPQSAAGSQKIAFDIKEDSPADDSPKDALGIGIEQLQLVLQAVLAEHFKLTLHRETKDLQVYELVIAEGGPKLQQSKPDDTSPNGIKVIQDRPLGRATTRTGEFTDQGTPLATLVEQLSWQLGHTVVDKTGLKGNYDFSLRWTPGPGEVPKFMGGKPDSVGSPESSGSTLLTAIQDQLGLKLEPQKAPMPVLVIDHVEPPASN
ncbi:MAG: M56 family metallopeptidase [Candidatus Sulfotelmatobacter sp.]